MMRLLLVAYEFPPSPSPQSLRWTYLVRELAARGHEMHVLAPDLGGKIAGLPELPASVTVHRTFAGPLRGVIALQRKRRQRRAARANAAGADRPSPTATADPIALRPPRGWKQRVSEVLQSILGLALFPDLRGEWNPWARPALTRLLVQLSPDLVIASHEPANTLELVRRACGNHQRWVADLGDPVLAGYTPRRWRRRARDVERSVCAQAALLTVTTAQTAALLRERYANTAPIQVLPQGYDARNDLAHRTRGTLFDPFRLELLYTGSLYRFRRIDALSAALHADPGLRLSIAAVTVPEQVMTLAARMPEQIRLLGFLPHRDVLALQRQADILVNIANDNPAQVPGKFHEYLGAGRPILHLSDSADATGALLETLRRGWSCRNDDASLHQLLLQLARRHKHNMLDAGLNLDQAPVAGYSWQAIAARLEAALQSAARRAATDVAATR